MTFPAICLYISTQAVPADLKRELFLHGIDLLDQCGLAANHLEVFASGKQVMKGRTVRRMLPRIRTMEFAGVSIASAGRFENPRDAEASRNVWQSKARLVCETGSSFEPMPRRVTFFVGVTIREPGEWPATSKRLIEMCRTVPDVHHAYVLLARQDSYPEQFDFEFGMVTQDKYRSREESENRLSWTRYGAWVNRHLRDVYPINIMPKAFYERPIEGMTLARWIAAEPRRGELAPLTPELTVWRPDWTNLPELRRRLFRANLLHWHGFYEHVRGCPPGPGAIDVRVPHEIPAMFDTPDEFFGDIPITR